MIVISDRILRQAGLTLAEAKALLAPAEAELVVHIRQCLDDISSPVIAEADDLPFKQEGDDGGQSVRPTSGASAGADPVLPTIEPTMAAVEDRHYTLGAAVKLAAKHEMTLAEAGGVFTVTSVWGQQPYVSLADAVAAIRQYGRWREAVRQTIDTQTRRTHERL